MVISKQESFNRKLGTAPISVLVEVLYLDIGFIVGPNASLDDGPYKTTISHVARVKGSCLLQIRVRGVLVVLLAFEDWCTLNNLFIIKDIF